MIKSDIAVIGAGFSAAATVINLLENLPPEKSVAIAGSRDTFGLGTAYSTRERGHRLNVSAARMSLYPDRPDHLLDWLSSNNHGFGGEDFIPRQLYGHYIRDTLDAAIRHNDNRTRIHFIDAEAIDCERFDEGGHAFHLSNGEMLFVRHSVLCLGGTPAGLPLTPDAVEAGARPYVTINSWAEDWVAKVDAEQAVFLLGSGLTTMDQLISLKRAGHKGPIHILSRHGLVPLRHRVPRSHPGQPLLVPGKHKLSEMLHILRDAANAAEDWRTVVDGIRPITQALWQEMTLPEKQRFFRHANCWWNVHRHRMAPEIASVFEDMQASGQLKLHAGWLQSIRHYNGQARIAFRDRKTGTVRQISADRFVNCTGMEKCSISRVPLLKKMAAKGMIAADRLGLGLALNAQSVVLAGDGRNVANAYAMGPMATGQFFEIFAVPDIRVQARQIAEQISLSA